MTIAFFNDCNLIQPHEQFISTCLSDTPIVCKERFSLFVGTEYIKNVQLVYGIEIKPSDKSSFKYTLTTVRNWKKTTKVMGEALLDQSPDEQYLMRGLTDGELVPCFRFFDMKNKVFIDISKAGSLVNSLVLVKRIMGGGEKLLTPLLHNK